MDYNQLPSQEVIDKTIAGLQARNVEVHFVQNKAEALATLKELIPAGAELNTASSTTLEQIGFTDMLKSKEHPWKNWKDKILAETDPAKQRELRKQSLSTPYFIGSIHALTEDGQALDASNSGSQIPGYAFASDNVIWVIGAQKIVPTLQDGFDRIAKHVVPLEDKRMKSTGAPGTKWSQTYIFHYASMPWRKYHVILVNEVLGF